MKYNNDYYILCYDPNAKNKRRVDKVKGSGIVYGFVEYSKDYEFLPKLFIYKDGKSFVLSDALSGLRIVSFYSLKNVKEWMEMPDTTKAILERYNTDATKKNIELFCKLINESSC